jgi:hypothetical protein
MSAPVVYLDQNHWITLSRARVARHKVDPPAELAAADHFIGLVESGTIRTPLSTAHLVETARAGDGPRRRDVAATMLSLHGGWFMADPMTVRQAEVASGLSREVAAPASQQVFSQLPGTPFHGYEPHECKDPSLPQELQDLVELLAWRESFADVLTGAVDSPDEARAAQAATERWSESHNHLTDFLSQNPADRDIRLVAAARTYGDLGVEIAKVAAALELRVDDYSAVLNADTVLEFFGRLPLLARIVAVTEQRLRDPRDRWTDHDLLDLFYLSCAAAYADVVVAERKFTHLLRLADKTSPSGAAVVPNLRSLAALLTVQSSKHSEPVTAPS